MLESIGNNTFEYQKLSPEEMRSRGILGRLVGVCASFIAPTRNGRKYGEGLWENVFNDPIMKEKIENGVCFGELGHPIDGREEVDMSKVAICLAEQPKKGSDGKLRAVFDILSTPCGQLLNTLCQYGSKIGISSRGSGDTHVDSNGDESVDEDTYTCECFDAVLVPAVKEARLQYVTESLNKKTLKQALSESLDNAPDSDRAIMERALMDNGISLTEDKHICVDCGGDATEQYMDKWYCKKCYDSEGIEYKEPDGNFFEDIDTVDGEDIKADNADDSAGNAGEDLVNSLHEALKEKKQLERELSSLQEKLSVCYAKESEYEEKLAKYRGMAESVKSLTKESAEKQRVVESLRDALMKKEAAMKHSREMIEQLKSRCSSMSAQNTKLNESISSNRDMANQLKDRLNESIKNLTSENSKLVEQMEEMKKDSAIKNSEYSKKIASSNQLVEKYKKIASVAVDKYINSQASIIGVTSDEIKSRLNEGYSFNDIDSVCESLKDYRLNISKLPFNVSKTVKMEARSQKSSITEGIKKFVDDDVDSQLMFLAENINK